MGVMNPGLVMRNIIPVVMAGVLGIYGLIVAVILSGSSESKPFHCIPGACYCQTCPTLSPVNPRVFLSQNLWLQFYIGLPGTSM